MKKRVLSVIIIAMLLLSITPVTNAFAQTKRKPGTVVVLATGGTIAGSGKEGENSGYTPGKISVKQLIDSVPDLSDLCPIEAVQVFNKASDDITYKDMATLAKTINSLAKDSNVAGFVVTHGTDTLEETAYFLNLTVKTKKPVVVTGAMRPATGLSADGNQNLYESVKVASSKESEGRGVMVVFSDKIYSARYVTKINNRSVTAMDSRLQGCMGEVSDEDLLYYYHIDKKHTVDTEFDVSKMKFQKKVGIFYFESNADPEIARYIINKSDGVIIAGAGDGAVSGAAAEVIGSSTKPYVNVSRTGSGCVSYCGDDQGWLISGADLNPQKAAILLMLALETTNDPNKIRKMFREY
ncbi:MAG: asparaginase [Lachnospiraceae bacterium]|nr:asparaginase [Lachnospiraceae bacterium]